MAATFSLRRFQKGEGKFGGIIALIVVLAVVYICYKMIPVYVKVWDFEDKVENIARTLAATKGVTEESVKESLLAEAKRLDLPVTEDDVQLEMTYNTVSVKVNYTMTVEFPGYTWKKNFEHSYSGRVFR